MSSTHLPTFLDDFHPHPPAPSTIPVKEYTPLQETTRTLPSCEINLPPFSLSHSLCFSLPLASARVCRGWTSSSSGKKFDPTPSSFTSIFCFALTREEIYRIQAIWHTLLQHDPSPNFLCLPFPSPALHCRAILPSTPSSTLTTLTRLLPSLQATPVVGDWSGEGVSSSSSPEKPLG